MSAGDLPAEAGLRALAQRFAVAERRVRALLVRAPAGDRRELLHQALLHLLGLRKEAQAAAEQVEAAYAGAALAVHRLTGYPTPDPTRARELGRSLAAKLDRAVTTADLHARLAFATARAENLESAALDAVTARVARDGRRVPLGAEAAMLTSTIGRHAVSRGATDPLPADHLVTIYVQPTGDAPCHDLGGNYTASGVPLPPYHPSCQCVASPGYTVEVFAAAMRA